MSRKVSSAQLDIPTFPYPLVSFHFHIVVILSRALFTSSHESHPGQTVLLHIFIDSFNISICKKICIQFGAEKTGSNLLKS